MTQKISDIINIIHTIFKTRSTFLQQAIFNMQNINLSNTIIAVRYLKAL